LRSSAFIPFRRAKLRLDPYLCAVALQGIHAHQPNPRFVSVLASWIPDLEDGSLEWKTLLESIMIALEKMPVQGPEGCHAKNGKPLTTFGECSA
jgi:hypothetical protein